MVVYVASARADQICHPPPIAASVATVAHRRRHVTPPAACSPQPVTASTSRRVPRRREPESSRRGRRVNPAAASPVLNQSPRLPLLLRDLRLSDIVHQIRACHHQIRAVQRSAIPAPAPAAPSPASPAPPPPPPLPASSRSPPTPLARFAPCLHITTGSRRLLAHARAFPGPISPTSTIRPLLPASARANSRRRLLASAARHPDLVHSALHSPQTLAADARPSRSAPSTRLPPPTRCYRAVQHQPSRPPDPRPPLASHPDPHQCPPVARSASRTEICAPRRCTGSRPPLDPPARRHLPRRLRRIAEEARVATAAVHRCDPREICRRCFAPDLLPPLLDPPDPPHRQPDPPHRRR
ncbi:hypothetical protein Syun_001317 [Stephania yunnanensis]|uniref:Uncharacterized protein n=1 Tax=Stephania yunnanensis TaxID=152371 RepID=A0AAP0Q656_9MAGN